MAGVTGIKAGSFSEMTLIGAEEIERILKGLPKKVARKAISQPLRQAAKIVLAQAKQNVPIESGTLRKSLKVRVPKRSRKRQGLALMVATGKGWFKGDEFYGAFIEFGTKRIEAQHYVQRAFDQTKDRATAMLRQGILSNIENIVKGSRIK